MQLRLCSYQQGGTGMEILYGAPLTEAWQQRVQSFLNSLGLGFENSLDFTVVLHEGENILATGSRRGNVLQCIGVSPERQGEGLSAAVVTELTKEAFAQGLSHLFLYTRPHNRRLFAENGFYPVAHTDTVLLMENKRNGARQFAENILCQSAVPPIGCIVANCNPFTFGHQYLAEYAAAKCGHVYFLVLSEDKSLLPAEARYRLAQQGLAHLPNVSVHPTGDYLISSATFPTYFLKDKIQAEEAYYDLDIAVFAGQFAPVLGIETRFVGSEPADKVTAGYNRRMKELLPTYGVTVDELPRKMWGEHPVSAGTVRRLMEQKDFSTLARYVPGTTLSYITEVMQHGG